MRLRNKESVRASFGTIDIFGEKRETQIFESIHDSISIKQEAVGRYDAVIDGTHIKGEFLTGWLDITGEDYGVTVAVRDFWQQFPKSIDYQRGVLTIGLLQDNAEEFVYPYEGMSKTHEIVFSFHGAEEEQETIARCAEALNMPLFVRTSPQWYEISQATRNLILSKRIPEDFRSYDDNYAIAFARMMDQKYNRKEYGMMNYGDFSAPEYYTREGQGKNIVWVNNEYDIALTLLTQFMRTGDKQYLRAGSAMAKHRRDVDTVHAGDNLGRVHYHHVKHAESGFHAGHVWLEGLLLDYVLTGVLLDGLAYYHQLTADERVAAAIVKGADWLIQEAWSEEEQAFYYKQCYKYKTLYKKESPFAQIDFPEVPFSERLKV